MRALLFLLVSLVPHVHGRRVQASRAQSESHQFVDRRFDSKGDTHALKGLGALLLALHSQAVFNPSAFRLSAPQGTHYTTSRTSGFDRRWLQPRLQAVEQEDEVKEVLTDMGKWGGSAIALHYGATTYAGVNQNVASATIVCALIGVAAYYFYFDGGYTQKGLVLEADTGAGFEEGDVMEEAPAANITVMDGQAAAADSSATVHALKSDGFARVNKVLSQETAKELFDYISPDCDEKRELAKEGNLLIANTRFGECLNPGKRYDFFLKLDPPVRKALLEAIEKVKPTIVETLGDDAELEELSALITDPKAPRQIVHYKLPSREEYPDVACVRTSIALTANERNRGQGVIPKSNTPAERLLLLDPEDGGRPRIRMLQNYPVFNEAMEPGDATLMDTRSLLYDNMNDSEERRVLFYFSFRSSERMLPFGSMLGTYKSDVLTISETDEWLTEEGWEKRRQEF